MEDLSSLQPRAMARRQHLARAGAFGGMLGPLILGGTIGGLTVVQYRFMRGLGWHPLDAPTFDWPSGLALGPYGDLMVAGFVVSGALLAGFAGAVDAALPRTRLARLTTVCWYAAALALALLAFRGDPTIRTTPRTLHGTVHDAAFALLGTTLLPGLALLVPELWRQGRRRSALYTACTALLVAPAFALKGLWFYLFLLNSLVWIELAAWDLWRRAQKRTAADRTAVL